MMMMPSSATFMGMVSCGGGTEFCLITTDGRRIDLAATPQTIDALNSLSDTGVLATVSGTLLSSPDAPRPRIQVTMVSGAAPAPTPMPTPEPSPMVSGPLVSQEYINCVADCIGEKAPELAIEEIFNAACARTLLAMGVMQPAAGAVAVADLPATIVALASCVAFTAGFSVGEVLECFLACLPGGRLAPAEFRVESSPNETPMGSLMQQAVALSQQYAARGISVTPAQILPLLARQQLINHAARASRRP